MSDRLSKFENTLRAEARAFYGEFERARATAPEAFQQLGDQLLLWAEAALGESWTEVLVHGYCEFVIDVNRSQRNYEQTGRYENSSFDDVYKHTYSNPEFMQLYHWGVFTTTFVWAHHLRIYAFFEREFLPLLRKANASGRLVDLGSGSGIWHLLALKHLSDWSVTAVDISAPTVERSRKMAGVTPFSKHIEHVVADALKWSPAEKAQAGISCFLLEHLEQPHALLANLGNTLAPGAPAFITAALTAAEVDHIYEFRRESELVMACEQAGFRVKSLLSAEPENAPRERYFLPRSVALVLQKRANGVW